MKLHVIDTGFFKLDGGAMFGVVPKSIWSKTNIPDDNNLCTWAMRLLLVEDGKRLMLIDTGIGMKQSEKFFSHYFLHGNDTLDGSLAARGFDRDDITDVFLTHLHFDHCGGAIEYNEGKDAFRPAFKNATYWSNAQHWLWATEPNAREKASFLSENIQPIKESGQLQLIPTDELFKRDVFPGIDVLFVHGHTDAMMIPHIRYKGKTIVYMADLLPSVGHVPLPYVMGYDTRPLLTLAEKGKFMDRAAEENFVLFLEHDNQNECCTVKQTEKGVRLNETFRLADL